MLQLILIVILYTSIGMYYLCIILALMTNTYNSLKDLKIDLIPFGYIVRKIIQAVNKLQ